MAQFETNKTFIERAVKSKAEDIQRDPVHNTLRDCFQSCKPYERLFFLQASLLVIQV